MVYHRRREASLRMLKLGYKAIYINKSYGRGLMPLSFDGFKSSGSAGALAESRY
jgi:hypothetical protein